MRASSELVTRNVRAVRAVQTTWWVMTSIYVGYDDLISVITIIILDIYSTNLAIIQPSLQLHALLNMGLMTDIIRRRHLRFWFALAIAKTRR